MGRKNKLVNQVVAMNEAHRKVMILWYTQLCYDCVAIVLNQEFGWGKERLTKLGEELNSMWNDLSTALEDHPEADYKREVIDRRVVEIFGEDTPRWEERYYGWKDKGDTTRRRKQ